jgi:hypothetical protein
MVGGCGGGLRKIRNLSHTRITLLSTPHSIFQRGKSDKFSVLANVKTLFLELINSKINELKV